VCPCTRQACQPRFCKATYAQCSCTTQGYNHSLDNWSVVKPDRHQDWAFDRYFLYRASPWPMLRGSTYIKVALRYIRKDVHLYLWRQRDARQAFLFRLPARGVMRFRFNEVTYLSKSISFPVKHAVSYVPNNRKQTCYLIPWHRDGARWVGFWNNKTWEDSRFDVCATIPSQSPLSSCR
jgi:hypothetical protein